VSEIFTPIAGLFAQKLAGIDPKTTWRNAAKDYLESWFMTNLVILEKYPLIIQYLDKRHCMKPRT
jgi:hypothetical protein